MPVRSQAPGRSAPILNFRSFPTDCGAIPFRIRVNLFEIVHLMKCCGRRGSFAPVSASSWNHLSFSPYRQLRHCRSRRLPQRKDSTMPQARRWEWTKGHYAWLRAAVIPLSGGDLGRWGTVRIWRGVPRTSLVVLSVDKLVEFSGYLPSEVYT